MSFLECFKFLVKMSSITNTQKWLLTFWARSLGKWIRNEWSKGERRKEDEIWRTRISDSSLTNVNMQCFLSFSLSLSLSLSLFLTYLNEENFLYFFLWLLCPTYTIFHSETKTNIGREKIKRMKKYKKNKERERERERERQ